MSVSEEEIQRQLDEKNELDKMQLDAALRQSQISQANQQMDMEKQNLAMFQEQISLNKELMNRKHFLRNDVLVEDEKTGKVVWKPNPEKSKIFLTEDGVQYFLRVLSNYSNKNILLGAYTEERVYQKMKNIGRAIVKTIKMKYEEFFTTPNRIECYEILDKRTDDKVDLRYYELIYNGIDESKIDKKEIKKEFIKEMQGKVEKELEIIKKKVLNDNHKNILSLVRETLDFIEGTYSRAIGGQERKTSRQHIHTHENVGGNQQPMRPQKRGLLSWGN